jgi:hypothetical protein
LQEKKRKGGVQKRKVIEAPAWKASGAFSFLNVDIENIYIQEKKSHAGPYPSPPRRGGLFFSCLM